MISSLPLSPLVIERLGWTLVHFAWQGALIGLGTLAVLRVVRGARPHVRYVITCVSLALMVAAPLTTFVTLSGSGQAGLGESATLASGASAQRQDVTMVAGASGTERARGADRPTGAIGASAGAAGREAVSRIGALATGVPQEQVTLLTSAASGDVTGGAIPVSSAPTAGAGVGRGVATGASGDQTPAVASGSDAAAPPMSLTIVTRVATGLLTVQRTLPWLVGLWSLGVALLLVRLFGGLLLLDRLTHHTRPAGEDWQLRLVVLARRLDVRRAIALRECTSTHSPAVIGWLRPVILLPVSVLAGLTPDQVEAILAHELAHIRRHDYIVNLLQSVAETLLFYHPAVWLVSRQIRIEREHCCDDDAVAVCGDAVTYASALADLERLRGSMPALALAASGGSLLSRVQRLLAPAPRSPFSWPTAGAFAAGLAMLGFMVTVQGSEPPQPRAVTSARSSADRGTATSGTTPAEAQGDELDALFDAPPQPPAPPAPARPAAAPVPPAAPPAAPEMTGTGTPAAIPAPPAAPAVAPMPTPAAPRAPQTPRDAIAPPPAPMPAPHASAFPAAAARVPDPPRPPLVARGEAMASPVAAPWPAARASAAGVPTVPPPAMTPRGAAVMAPPPPAVSQAPRAPAAPAPPEPVEAVSPQPPAAPGRAGTPPRPAKATPPPAPAAPARVAAAPAAPAELPPPPPPPSSSEDRPSSWMSWLWGNDLPRSSYSLSDGTGRRLAVLSRGNVTLKDDDSDILQIDEGGYFKVEERIGGVRKRVELRARNGQLQRRWLKNGVEADYDGEARQWFARTLKDLGTRTGLGAEKRIERLLTKSGPSAVVDASSQLQSDHVKRMYLEAALESPALDGPTQLRILTNAESFDSSYERAELLRSVVARGMTTDETRLAYVKATQSIDSDFERARTLKALLETPQSGPVVAAALKSAADMHSDFELAELLVKASRQQTLETLGNTALVDASRGIDSAFERRRALTPLAERPALAGDVQAALLSSASDIDSDFERAELLSTMVKRQALTDAARPAFFAAIGKIDSDFERARTLKAMLSSQTTLTEAALRDVISSTLTMDSDMERANVLTMVAARPLSEQTRAAFMQAAARLDSEMERNRTLSSLVRRESAAR